MGEPNDGEGGRRPGAVVGGKGLSQRVMGGEKLRPERRGEEVDAKRLTSGEAWRDFCRSLERTGEFVLEADNPADDRTRAEAYRYLLGMLNVGVRQAFDLGNREFPTFTRIEDPWAKWGAENADNHYLHTHIQGDRSYRIRGTRGTCLDFLIEVKEGFMHMGDVRNFAAMKSGDLEIAADGSFELIASVQKPEDAVNWLPLDVDATQITIREYFYDWENEEAARFTIECIETLGDAPEPASPASMARVLDDAGHFVEMTTRFWSEWVPGMREAHVRGELVPAKMFVGGADDIRYGNDMFQLGADEALIIETDLPDARYWHYQLCNTWFVTMDYANRSNSINGAQAYIDPDGRFRCVIAHSDPGVPNWLDTSGQTEGMIQYRYVWTKDSPEPSVRIVPHSEIWEHMPEGTPRISREERRAVIASRQRGVARRFRM